MGENAAVATSGSDYDAIVIGAGHNGLVTAAYLARAGLSTLLVEARDRVGGTAASETFAGATVNICNCDHLTFRTTPVVNELDLAAHGLRYLDVAPGQHNAVWGRDPASTVASMWSSHHDIDATLAEIERVAPADAEGYRRYLNAAIPAVELIFAAANEAPTPTGLVRHAGARRFRGSGTLLRWSRRSAGDVLRAYFGSETLRASAAAVGPMVWGSSPEFAGSGLGALTHAMRHVAKVGRPVGGSGEVPRTLQCAFDAAGGDLRTSTRVVEICCTGDRVSGVRLQSTPCSPNDGDAAMASRDGAEFVSAPIVV